jgi:membrane dipeptidase
MYLIDAHEDLAYNALNYGRDYRLSAAEIRQQELETEIPKRAGGQATLGWADYQRGQVALVFGTIFTAHRRYASGPWDTGTFKDVTEARKIYHQQFDFYARLTDTDPQKFRLVRSQKELKEVLQPWDKQPARFPQVTHPVGLVLLMENAEGIERPEELEEYWQRGLRLIGPVWSGGRFCGGTKEPGGFTSEGRRFLEVMADLGFTLDIAHMNEESALEALDRYPGPVIASHANARAILRGGSGERQLTDRTIAQLVERSGVMGVVPFNRFLKPDWQPGDDRAQVGLEMVAAHIDHICQIAGDAAHAAIGSDFDGGFGWPSIPQELDTIADLQKLEPLLTERGYGPADISAIFSGNWRRVLETILS